MPNVFEKFKNNQRVNVDTTGLYQPEVVVKGIGTVLGFCYNRDDRAGWIVLIDNPTAAGMPLDDYPFSAIVLPDWCLTPIEENV